KGAVTRPLVVRHAESGKVDEKEYAPVDSAEVGMLSHGKLRAVIEGRFQDTCTEIDKIELSTQNGQTYELLPLIRRRKTAPDGSPCRLREHRYTAHQDFDEPDPGRYLLHVRTRNGKSVNHIFTNVW